MKLENWRKREELKKERRRKSAKKCIIPFLKSGKCNKRERQLDQQCEQHQQSWRNKARDVKPIKFLKDFSLIPNVKFEISPPKIILILFLLQFITFDFSSQKWQKLQLKPLKVWHIFESVTLLKLGHFAYCLKITQIDAFEFWHFLPIFVIL